MDWNNKQPQVVAILEKLQAGKQVDVLEWARLLDGKCSFDIVELQSILGTIEHVTGGSKMSVFLIEGLQRDWNNIKRTFLLAKPKTAQAFENYINDYLALTSKVEPAQVYTLSDEGREELAKKVFSKDFLEYKDADGKDVYMTFIHTFENLANGKGAGKGKKGAAALLKMARDGKLKDGKTNKANLIAKGLEYGNVARHFAEAYNMYMTKDYYKSSKIDYTTAQVPPYISLREHSK